MCLGWSAADQIMASHGQEVLFPEPMSGIKDPRLALAYCKLRKPVTLQEAMEMFSEDGQTLQQLKTALKEGGTRVGGGGGGVGKGATWSTIDGIACHGMSLYVMLPTLHLPSCII